VSQETDLFQKLDDLGQRLIDSFVLLLTPIVGSEPKPNDIGDALALDRTQSWRVHRILTASDPLTALHESPAPKGLGAIIDAAERAGGDGQALQAARRAAAAFAAVIHEFPDGRAGLDAALSGRVPKALDAAIKSARKGVSAGMSQLLGLRAAVRYVGGIITPSPDLATTADVIAVAGYKDLRRLRMGPSPIVFSGRTYTQSPRAGDPALLTIDGKTDPDPRLRMLEPYCSIPADALQLERSDDELRLTLAPDMPSVNEVVTLFFAQRIARSLARHRMEGRECEIVHHAPVLPSDVNVFDTFIHKDLFPKASPPKVTVERFGFNPVVQSRKPDDRAYRVDDIETLSVLGHGLRQAPLRAIPNLTEIMTFVFGQAGLDPDDYRLYRTSVEYLPPGFAVVVWLPLTAAD
jgi:hypothetical protein